MCWVAYIALDKPLSDWRARTDDRVLRIDSLDAPISEPTPAGVKHRSPHLSLPHVYLAHVGAECGFSCGIDHPRLRSQIHSVIQEELSKGTRIEVVFSHADYIHADLECSVAMTPSALQDIQQDWETRAGKMDDRDYETLHAAVPLGNDRFFFQPRRIRFVSESELENSSTGNAASQRFNEKFRAYAGERHPEWSDRLVFPEPTNPTFDFVRLVLPNPRGEQWSSLEVRPEGAEIQGLMVSFALHHAHFAHDDENRKWSACFDLVEGILEERIVAVVLGHANRPYVSDFCHVEDLPAVEAVSRPRQNPGWLKRLLGLGPKTDSGSETTWRSYGPVHYSLGPPPPGPCRLDVYSWLGTHDRRSVLS